MRKIHLYRACPDTSYFAAIGVDIDGNAAEVWGPFNTTKNEMVQLQLWEELQNTYPFIEKYYFFINEQNIEQIQFMGNIGADKEGEHLLLEVIYDTFEPLKVMKSTV